MGNLVFLAVLGAGCALFLGWGFKNLPHERWQIAAAVPIRKGPGGWSGLNITYYGVLIATAYTLAIALMLVMLGAVGVEPVEGLIFAAPLLSASLPAAKVVARVVEGKKHTFTIGGASFVALILAPWLVMATELTLAGGALPVLPTLAALAVAYAFGEGLGRLACISFGCCYGKPLDQAPAWLSRILHGRAFVFMGDTKKVAYEGHLAGQPVVPIQAITAVLYVAAGLIALGLFLAGWFRASFWLAIVVTQGWRAVSELFRADFRGESRITAYQWMALIALAYSVLVGLWFPNPAGLTPSASRGLGMIWSPGVLLTLQAMWLGACLWLGRSRTTASRLRFYVVQEHI